MYSLSRIVPVRFTSVCRLGTHHEACTAISWWQWRDRIYRVRYLRVIPR